LEKTPASLQALVLPLQETIECFAKRVAETEAWLGQNSLSSNGPPSSEAPQQRVKRSLECTQQTDRKKIITEKIHFQWHEIYGDWLIETL